jgi:bla regulator protein BlaR1
MNAELIRVLCMSVLASSAAIIVMLTLRGWLRARFGARVAYAAWALVPIASAVAWLPPPVVVKVLPALAVSNALSKITTVPVDAMQVAFDPLPWILAMWLLGAGLALTGLLLQQRNFVRALGRLSAIDTGVLRAESTSGCPALVGALRPRIVLPSDFEQRYDVRERELILAHEQAHRARGDAQVNALAALLRCIFWFNPLVYFAASRFRFDQELACDAAVISRFPEARRRYADAMLKTQLAVLGLPVGCHWQSSHPLKERIAMLKHPLPGRTRVALGFGLATLLVVGGSYAAWAAQPAAAAPANKSSDANAVGTAGPSNAPAASNAAAASAAPESAPNERKAGYRALRPIAYPAGAVAAKVQGVVYVDVRIASDGSVTEARVDHVDPPAAGSVLAAAAVAGVKTWTFDPARKHGRNIASSEIVPIGFALDAGNDAPRVSHTALEAIFISPQAPGVGTVDGPPSEDVSFRVMFPPHYPQEAVRAKQSAHMTFDVLVDEQGIPQSVAVAHSDPPEAAPMFTQASVDAIKKWHFNPAIKEGKPHAGHIEVPIDFVLREDEG